MQNRRQVNQTLALMLASLFLFTMMLTGTAAAKPLTAEGIHNALAKYRGESLTITSWGGSYQDAQRKAYYEPFSHKFGIKIIEDSPADNSKIMAMVKAKNVTWDVVDAGSYKCDNLGEEGYLEELDFNIIDNRDLLDGFWSKWHVATIAWSELLGYRTDVFSGANVPTHCTDIWNVKKFPGRRSLRDNPIFNIPLALLADGMELHEIYPLTEAKIQRAFNKLDEIKPHINVWWTQGAQPPQLLTDKEVVMATGWNGRISTLKKDGVPVDVVFPGSQLVGDSWIIPKGAKKKELSMLFIAWASLPENNWELSTMIDYGPVNKRSFKRLTDETLANMPISKVEQSIICDFSWWAHNYSDMVERWREWKLQ